MRSPPGSTITTQVPVAVQRVDRDLELDARAAQLLDRRRGPRRSSPTRATSSAGTPCSTSRAATLAPPPPGRCVICAGVSEAWASGADARRDDVGHQVADDDDRAHALAATAILAGQLGVAQHQSHVGAQALTAGLRVEAREQERRDVAAAHALALGGGERLGEHALVQRGVELLVERVGDHERAASMPSSARARSAAATSSGESSRHGAG